MKKNLICLVGIIALSGCAMFQSVPKNTVTIDFKKQKTEIDSGKDVKWDSANFSYNPTNGITTCAITNFSSINNPMIVNALLQAQQQCLQSAIIEAEALAALASQIK